MCLMDAFIDAWMRYNCERMNTSRIPTAETYLEFAIETHSSLVTWEVASEMS
jgi:hypothetical protein